MAIDLHELDEELMRMRPWQPMYKVVKRALSERGWWKNRPRGAGARAFSGKDKDGK